MFHAEGVQRVQHGVVHGLQPRPMKRTAEPQPYVTHDGQHSRRNPPPPVASHTTTLADHVLLVTQLTVGTQASQSRNNFQLSSPGISRPGGLMTQELEKESVAEIDIDTMTATRETLEDYTLRFAPRSYRRWSAGVVGISALGGIAYLADFAIGANIGISYGTTNALWGIAIFSVVIFATGLPLAYYAARYNIDLDLITRGSGFGYYGSVVTKVIFATFTFIFFALERLDHGAGSQAGIAHPVVARLSVLDADHLPAGHLWHESALAAAALDHPAVADPDGDPVRLPGRQSPVVDRPVLRVRRQGRARWFQPGLHTAGSGCVLVVNRPNRRADRLFAVHATAHPGKLAQLV